MAIKKGDFVEIDFVGRVKASNAIFDTSIEAEAKKAGMYNEKETYKPLVICVGEGHILQGIDKFVESKELGEYELDVPAAEAFGKRDPRLIQLTTLAKFKSQNMMPMPGLQVVIDGAPAVIRSVNGGRVIIDFNHPLAGRDLHYKIKITREVTKPEEKLAGMLWVLMHIRDAAVELKDGDAVVKIKRKLPDVLAKEFEKQAKKLISELKSVSFKAGG